MIGHFDRKEGKHLTNEELLAKIQESIKREAIAGIESARVWVGDLTSKQIIEIAECEKEGDL